MTPDRDTMLCLNALVQWYGSPSTAPTPIEAKAIAALAQRILNQMHHELDELNAWADAQAGQHSDAPF